MKNIKATFSGAFGLIKNKSKTESAQLGMQDVQRAQFLGVIFLIVYIFALLLFFRPAFNTNAIAFSTVVLFFLIYDVYRVVEFLFMLIRECRQLLLLQNNPVLVERIQKVLKNYPPSQAELIQLIRIEIPHYDMRSTIFSALFYGLILRWYSRTQLDVEQLISETFEVEFRKIRFILNMTASICIGIGLLGTFYGISESLNNNPLNALNMSIGSSLIGIFSSIMVYSYLRIISRLEASVSERVSQYLLAHWFRFFQVRHDLQLVIDATTAKIIGNEIGSVVASQTATAFSALRTMLENLVSRLDTYVKLINTATTELNSATKLWINMPANLEKVFNRLAESLGKLNTEVMENTRMLNGTDLLINKTLTNFSDTANALDRDLLKWLESPAIKNHDDAIRTAAKDFVDLLEASKKEMSENLGKYTTSTTQAVSQLNNALENQTKKLEGLPEVCSAIKAIVSNTEAIAQDSVKTLKMAQQIVKSRPIFAVTFGNNDNRNNHSKK